MNVIYQSEPPSPNAGAKSEQAAALHEGDEGQRQQHADRQPDAQGRIPLRRRVTPNLRQIEQQQDRETRRQQPQSDPDGRQQRREGRERGAAR